MCLLGDDIDLSVPTAKVALQNAIALADQRFCRQALSCATKSLTRPFNWFGFIGCIVYELSPTISYVAPCSSVVKHNPAFVGSSGISLPYFLAQFPLALYPPTIEQSGMGSFLLCCLLVTPMSCT